MLARIAAIALFGSLFAGAAPIARALDAGVAAPLDGASDLAPLPVPLESVREDDRGALETLALYQEPVRTAILEVARHPQTLIALDRIQADTRAEFDALIAPLSDEELDQIWELVRYPELIDELVAGGDARDLTRGELEQIAAPYPEEIRAAAVDLGRDHHELLVEVHWLERAFQAQFEGLVQGLPSAGEAAFRTALDRPEVLEILSEHMHLTVLLGEAYQRNPERLDTALASVANDVAARTAEARADWVRSLEEDPEAQAELEQAAEAYAAEQGLDYEVVTRTRYVTDATVFVHPYPYWFGLPVVHFGFYLGFHPHAWYWYPRHHHHFGFYFGAGHSFVVYGYPSHFFLSWYFGFGSHCDHYPHLSRHFTRHHVTHRYSYDRVTHHVERWERTRHTRDVRSRDGRTRMARQRDSGRFDRGRDARVREPEMGRRAARRYLGERGAREPRREARAEAPARGERPGAEAREPGASELRRRSADARRAATARSPAWAPRRAAKSDADRSRRAAKSDDARPRRAARADDGRGRQEVKPEVDRSRRGTEPRAERSQRNTRSKPERSPRIADFESSRERRSAKPDRSATRRVAKLDATRARRSPNSEVRHSQRPSANPALATRQKERPKASRTDAPRAPRAAKPRAAPPSRSHTARAAPRQVSTPRAAAGGGDRGKSSRGKASRSKSSRGGRPDRGARH